MHNDLDPYAPPQTEPEARHQTPHDTFILGQVRPLLNPEEHVRYTAYLVRMPAPWLFVLAIGVPPIALAVLGVALPEVSSVGGPPLPALAAMASMLLVLLYAAVFFRLYLTAVTNRRVIMFRTRLGALQPRMLNLGVEQIAWKSVARIDVGGFANNRSLRFVLRDAPPERLRIAPRAPFVSGQRAFFEYARRYEAAEPTQ